ncbi:MAG: murein biosynthesis integral membrane protein MurJ [Vicinamibacterales bacterium]
MALAQTSDSSPPSSDRIAQAAGLAAAATLTSRLLGLAREQVLAALFGAGDQMDAYFVAFRIPNLVRDLFAEGAMSAAFVPTFTRHVTLHGKEDGWRLGNNVINALLLVTGVTVILGLIFARPLVSVYAHSFAAVPGKLELTTELARVMMPFVTLAALAAAVMGMLNSLRHYFVPALAPATFNVVAIVFALAVTPIMPTFGQPRIMAQAIAVVVGGLTQVGLQWPILRKEGFRYRPVLNLADPGLRQVLLLMGPGTLGLAATQVNLFVSTLLASSQGTGAVSWLQYAFRVMYLPIGLFGVSIATAVLPTAARHAAVKDMTAIRDTVRRGLSLMLFVNIPATCGLMLLSTEIVRLLLERGHFTAVDTSATAAALRLYALGLLGYSTARIGSPVFYALGRSRVPVALTMVSVTVNLVLSLILTRTMGYLGLALATSVAALVNASLCLYLLRAELQGLGGRLLAPALAKVVAAAAVMALAVLGSRAVLPASMLHGGTANQGVALLVMIGCGILCLIGTAHLLNIEELDVVSSMIRRKLTGRKDS